ncbi:putative phosphatidylethanolamine:Kdo2-lipid A phosphoethanolamine transferase [Magnetofaba australis IT-1]|uniref:Putative phosphatidylethanolamine:Kdo2-lipid A phosphoethanolamine transferase n=1 Tax=Magnetofaba australis IT-1 TaxID=1434232 RepID=A0A1Y2KA35_9PROT|nr:putative phosphatidylethanolamine:Kdo2-lipid A phosphoethanolamine transferase [Magnetofaba australis IT-1]
MTFFDQVTDVYPWADNRAFLISLVGILWAFLTLVLALFSLLLGVRPTATLFILLASAIGHYADKFGVVIDISMIENILATNPQEAGDLITPQYILRIALLGVLPTWLVWRARWRPAPTWLGRKRQLALAALLGVVVALGLALPHSGQVASFLREHKPLRYYANPAYAFYSAGKYAGRSWKSRDPGPLRISATHAARPTEDPGRDLIIVVVGETVRADHINLNGYGRNTLPQLSQEERLVSYANIHSCGTSTAVSVPCMFAFDGRDNFDDTRAKRTENVLDVLAKAGVNVLWRDNNSDSKGVALRVPFEDFRTGERNPHCDEVECRDTGLLSGLQEYIDSHSGDFLIVLHQMGNHGPAYYKRYTAEFEHFKPACPTAELSECTDPQIVNAYDNAIVATDNFLARAIDLLKHNDGEFETALLYISDHGESLGEKGLYLHGMPYLFAPKEQTHVAALLWAGESSDIDFEATQKLRDVDSSHDAVAGMLLSLFEISSDAPKHSAPSWIQLQPDHH